MALPGGMRAAVGPHGVAQGVAAGAPQRVAVGVRAAHACGALVHSVIFSLGLVFLLQVANIGVALDAQDHWSSAGTAVGSFRDAVVMLLRNLLLPFAEATFLDPMMPESSGIDVWGFWVPGLLSFFFLSVAWLGLSTIRWRRPSRAVPYALLAAVFLVWQAQVSHTIIEISTWEDLGPSTGPSQLSVTQQVQQYFFKMGHESFTQMYSERSCKVAQKVDGIPRLMRCSGETLEAKVMPLIVQEFCRAQSDDLEWEFDVRVNACKDQGLRMRVLGSKTQESDAFYCRCWAAVFDKMQSFSKWIMFIWLAMLLGVLSVLYIAAEPKLSRMGSREHSEVLCFAFISMALLACRVAIFPDGLPWAKGMAGMLQEE